MKHSIPKSTIILLAFICILFFLVIFRPIYNPDANIALYVILSTFILSILLVLTFSLLKYPVLTDNQLEIRNVLYPFYHKRYDYADIKKIEFCTVGPSLRIYLKSNRKHVFYRIDCIPPEASQEFTNKLSTKGIHVESLSYFHLGEIHNPINTWNFPKIRYFTSIEQIILWSLWILLLGFLTIFLLIYQTPAMIYGYIMLIVFILFIFLIMAAIFWKYPVLTDNGLEIKNVMYYSYKRHYDYSDIRKVEICRASAYHWPNLKIYLQSIPAPILHSIDCMSQDSIPEFLKELHEHGVDAVCLVEYK